MEEVPMLVAPFSTFKTDRKEPLAALLDPIHAAFPAAGECEPKTIFSLSDSPVPGSISSADRAVVPLHKRISIDCCPW
jgi:hypothetical protein